MSVSCDCVVGRRALNGGDPGNAPRVPHSSHTTEVADQSTDTGPPNKLILHKDLFCVLVVVFFLGGGGLGCFFF